MRRILLILAILAVLALAISSLANRSNQPNEAASQSNIPKVLNLNLRDYSGSNVNLAGYLQEGPMVVNSWASWCPFCVKELVDFAAVQQQFKDRVTIVAINRAESLAVAKRFTDQLDVSQKMVFLLDPGDSFYAKIGGFSMPETIFVNQDGKIVEHKRGPMSAAELEQKVKSLIGS